MSNNTDRKTKQRRGSTESFVLDSGATRNYYPTAFDEESPNEGSNRRSTQNYARYKTHVRQEQSAPTRSRLSAAGKRIQHGDISSNYCHTHAQEASHDRRQCLNFANLSVAEQRRIGRTNYLRNFR